MIEREKYGITPLSASGKEKYISGAADFGAAARSWLSYPTFSNSATMLDSPVLHFHGKKKIKSRQNIFL